MARFVITNDLILDTEQIVYIRVNRSATGEVDRVEIKLRGQENTIEAFGESARKIVKDYYYWDEPSVINSTGTIAATSRESM